MGNLAGRDIDASTKNIDASTKNIDASKNITVNVYGGENFDLHTFPGMIERVVDHALAVAERTPNKELARDQVLYFGMRQVTREPENRVLMGYDKKEDTVGVQEAPGRWGTRTSGEVAKDYAERLGPKLWASDPRLGGMETPEGEELNAWVKKNGARTIRGVAMDNEIDAEGIPRTVPPTPLADP